MYGNKLCVCVFPNTVQYIKTLMRLNKILAEATVIIEIIYFFGLSKSPTIIQSNEIFGKEGEWGFFRLQMFRMR